MTCQGQYYPLVYAYSIILAAHYKQASIDMEHGGPAVKPAASPVSIAVSAQCIGRLTQLACKAIGATI